MATETPLSTNLSQIESNGWNRDIEHALREKKNQCLSSKWMHNRQSDRYLEIHKWLTNVVVLLILVTTGSFFGTTSFTDSSRLWVRILLGVLGLSTAYLAKRYGDENYGLQSFLHKYASADWDWTYELINNEITASPENRQNARDFKRWVDSHIMRLLKTAPDVSTTVLGQYRKAFPLDSQDQFDKLQASQHDLLQVVVVPADPSSPPPSDTDEPKPKDKPDTKKSWSYVRESAKQRYEIDRYLRDNIS